MPAHPAPYPFAAVLFDLDGVIVDNSGLHREVWADFLRGHGHAPTPEQILATTGRRAREIVATHFGPQVGDDRITALAMEREVIYRARLAEGQVSLVAGVDAFLAGLEARGVPRVLATSASIRNVEAVFARFGLAGRFTARITAEDVQRGKPDPEVYRKAAAAAGFDPARCLVAEDALPGILAGKAAGATCLGLATGEPPEALQGAGADWVVPDFTALPEALRP